MRFDCIEKSLRRLFKLFGRVIARYPWSFLILPVCIGLGLGVGVLTHFTTENDIEKLYGPERTPSRRNRVLLEDIYDNVKDENMLQRHRLRIENFARIIVKPSSVNTSVLSPAIMEEVFKLHEAVLNVSILYEGEELKYSDLCLKWKGECTDNQLIALLKDSSSQGLDTVSLTYPLLQQVNGASLFLGVELGGVTLNSNNVIETATVLQLAYNLRLDTAIEDIQAVKWEKAFLDTVANFESSNLILYRFALSSLNEELEYASGVQIFQVAIVTVIVVTFSVFATFMFDWVRTKPILASLGVFSAGLALASTFGLLAFLGIPYSNPAGSMPFLVLGIGVDDMFILITAWRQTSVHKSTEDRMSEALEEAALSITITTVTDALAFGIGALSVFYSVRIFCLYASIAVVFAYIYIITFFAACMVIIGKREESNRHAITLKKVLPKEDAPSKMYYLCCAGGSSESRRNEEQEQPHTLWVVLFKDYYAPFITHPASAFFVILMYLGYLGVAIWGVVILQEGGDFRKNLASENSFVYAFFDIESDYFREFGPDMSVVAKSELNYWDPVVQKEIERVMTELEESDYFYDSTLSISWLREFLKYLEYINIVNPPKEAFLVLLRDQFLSFSVYEQFGPDIVFDSANKSIISSRFYVIGKELTSSDREREMFSKIRSVIAGSNLDLIPYHETAPLFLEQFLAIRSSTITTLGIGVAAMFVISLLLIPHPVCAIIVTFSVVLTVFGVLGFMSHWGIVLDSISMVTLIISLGFSVDYSAHISYAYTSSPFTNRRQKSIHALSTLGTPTLQGAISTILAVVVLVFADSYIFHTFVKSMVLVIVIGALHGLLFLPVFLMILVPTNCCTSKPPSNDSPQMKSETNRAFEHELT